MYRPPWFRLFASCIAAAAAAIGFLTAEGPARPADEPGPGGAICHADPKHLWNRLHEALFVRVGPDGRTYGRDRFEPCPLPSLGRGDGLHGLLRGRHGVGVLSLCPGALPPLRGRGLLADGGQLGLQLP